MALLELGELRHLMEMEAMPLPIIERIAHHADIDTRRALGFGPRKLVLPDLNLPFERNESFFWLHDFIELPKCTINYWYRTETVEWVFGTQVDLGYRCYSLGKDGIVTYRDVFKIRYSLHPDFNEGGTPRAWRMPVDRCWNFVHRVLKGCRRVYDDYTSGRNDARIFSQLRIFIEIRHQIWKILRGSW